MSTRIDIYDTTLRDGAQGPGVAFSVQDKLQLLEQLDAFGIDYVEGGFPLANEKEREFFEGARRLPLKQARLAAFGSTRKAGAQAQADKWLQALLEAETEVVTLVGKAWTLHVADVLRTTLDENLRMIHDSVAFMKQQGREVVFDSEHFFGGYRADREYALKTLKVAHEAGADVLVLCDTNGGSLPGQIAEAMDAVANALPAKLGVHTHNDSDMATANAVTAVLHGATHVQGTINGIGERCGNADLCTIVPNIMLKAGYECLDGRGLEKLTELSRYVYGLANMNWRDTQPFVGTNAFAHKGGLHIDAMQKNPLTYEHIDPALVGNERSILVSELSGRAMMLAKADKRLIDMGQATVDRVLAELQHQENMGYHFEAAEASFEILVRKLLGQHESFFQLEGFRVIVEKGPNGEPITEATLKISLGSLVEHTASEGDGPVNALDGALRKGIEHHYPSLRDMHLSDYRVRVINPKEGTAAKVRVMIESRDQNDQWGTIGVSENIIEASWLALVDSVEYKLVKDGVDPLVR